MNLGYVWLGGMFTGIGISISAFAAGNLLYRWRRMRREHRDCCQ